MNYLKKKLKPLTSGLTSDKPSSSSAAGKQQRHKDLEEDLYDEYVVEAPPHPSELLALGVDPTDIDVNDPEKLRALYRRAKEEGKDKSTNSILLARQRQKEEIELKKKTREEWKFFDSLNNRIEQVIENSQKNLEQLKQSSAIDSLAEPEYELKLSADQVFATSHTVKQEKDADNWVNFNEDESGPKTTQKPDIPSTEHFASPDKQEEELLKTKQTEIVKDLLEDVFGSSGESRRAESCTNRFSESKTESECDQKKLHIDLKVAARPRPRPKQAASDIKDAAPFEEPEVDPFDTSAIICSDSDNNSINNNKRQSTEPNAVMVDPFDTSYIKL